MTREPVLTSLSVVVPVYQERENLPELIDRLQKIKGFFPKFELILVDDNSGDGTEQFVQGLASDWIRLLVQRNERGLAKAVHRGLREARHETLLVMDGDLSHAPEAVPDLCAALLKPGTDFVIGSRFVKGGRFEQRRSLARRLNTMVATLLARPFTTARDPMSGFFALKRQTFLKADPLLDPVGYKIGLELIVKCGCTSVVEVPIAFAPRRKGKSKLSIKERLNYLRHLRRLARYKSAKGTDS